MNFRILYIFLFFVSCTQNNKIYKNDDLTKLALPFSTTGFTLVYDRKLNKNKIISKKMEDRSLILFQRNLKKNSYVKITNLINDKTLIAKVGSNSTYPIFYNSVISKRIANELEIDLYEPYIQILEIYILKNLKYLNLIK